MCRCVLSVVLVLVMKTIAMTFSCAPGVIVAVTSGFLRMAVILHMLLNFLITELQCSLLSSCPCGVRECVYGVRECVEC